MKKIICLLVTISALHFAFPAHAQQTYEEFAAPRLKNSDKKNYVSVAVENDNLGGGTDQFYSSGVRLSWFNVNTQVPDSIIRIASLIPVFSINETTSTSFSIGQNIFTPANIRLRQNQPDDRPWAGFLYGSVGLATLEDNHLDELELTLGIVGPEALGEQSQKFIHHHISNSPTPKGWRNQLDFEPGFVVSWQRRWPLFWYRDLGDFRLSAAPTINVSLGNIYTYAGGGMTLTFGPYQHILQDIPPRIRPSIPGTGFFHVPDQDWSWFLFAGVDGRAVGRNIFLDGNTFSDSPSVDKKIFVGDATAGLALTFDDYRISYAINARSEEFAGQDARSVFGSITLSMRF
jgi:hypothetical protein